MDLFIQIKDGQPFEHPILGDNFRQAFPDIDINNLSPDFAKFIRVNQNVTPGFYEVPYSTYEWVGDTVQDVWHLRQMTANEQAAKDQSTTEYLTASVEYLKKLTNEKIATSVDINKISELQNYLSVLNSWVMGQPSTTTIPEPPLGLFK